MKEFPEVMEMCYISFEEVVIQMDTIVETHGITCLKSLHFIVCKLYLTKLILKC